MRLIQHKREAYWFYRFLSLGYDRWVNPLFWTPAMRTVALTPARVDDRALRVLDVGAGTGFTTEGIVERVDAANVTMLDQSPHQLARSHRRRSLAACRRVVGDAEDLPFPDASFDRYVSAGSIEYWPDPARAIAEAHRVLRPGGIALVAGPLRPRHRVGRLLADTWMLFPEDEQYRAWFAAAGFVEVSAVYAAPEWHRGGPASYGIAIAGMREEAVFAGANGARAQVRGGALQAAGNDRPSTADHVDAPLTVREKLRFAGRFVVGSAAGAAFVPIAAALTARERLARRRGR
ncbi:MAG TPA: methyltransferase domain-containing protein [Solirubrobacteraceae bacterium]|nr:methyltransferase domain-containing protein [Solirubrobacteraceae bacterium]